MKIGLPYVGGEKRRGMLCRRSSVEQWLAEVTIRETAIGGREKVFSNRLSSLYIFIRVQKSG